MPAMRVIPWEHGRFWVTSETDAGKRYLVDLMEYNGQMKCDCENYRIALESKNLRGQCKHCNEVLMFLGRAVVKEMLKTMKH
jgi:hypothetical protein